MLSRVLLWATAVIWAGAAHALTLELPAAAKPLADQSAQADSYELPLGPFTNGAVPSLPLEGAVSRQSWQIGAQGLTSLQLFAPLREQLIADGYDVLYECSGADCGGFDFRFSTEVLPAPDMHVDLTDFRFLSARKGEDDHLSLLVSRTDNAGFLQLVRVSAGTDTPTEVTQVEVAQIAPVSEGAAPLTDTLNTLGRAVLDDLTFETGSSALGSGPFESLAALAAFLQADSERRVALVGHTDAVGSLDNNVALSKRRAAAVLERLVSEYDIPRAQLEAEGMGYLSPIAPNQTDAGREANRRVEVILLNTQ